MNNDPEWALQLTMQTINPDSAQSLLELAAVCCRSKERININHFYFFYWYYWLLNVCVCVFQGNLSKLKHIIKHNLQHCLRVTWNTFLILLNIFHIFEMNWDDERKPYWFSIHGGVSMCVCTCLVCVYVCVCTCLVCVYVCVCVSTCVQRGFPEPAFPLLSPPACWWELTGIKLLAQPRWPLPSSCHCHK